MDGSYFFIATSYDFFAKTFRIALKRMDTAVTTENQILADLLAEQDGGGICADGFPAWRHCAGRSLTARARNHRRAHAVCTCDQRSTFVFLRGRPRT
jgi:hypothetical protein